MKRWKLKAVPRCGLRYPSGRAYIKRLTFGVRASRDYRPVKNRKREF